MDFGYPVVLDLRDVPVLVVGGGPIGVRKIGGLVAAGAAVTVVATSVTGPLDRTTVVEVRERPFEPGDLDGARLVVTATGIEPVDAAVAAAARERGIWVNAADQAEDCGFILPAIARAGTITIAVSTDGASPALARRVRDHCARLLTPEVLELAEALRAERRALQAAGGSTEVVDWSPRIDPVLPPAEPPL